LDRAALVAFVSICLLRGGYLFDAVRRAPILREPLADSIAYLTWMKAIAAGAWTQAEPFYRAPLYPYLAAPVAALLRNPAPLIVVAQTIAGCLTVLLVWRIARRLYGAPAGLIAVVAIGFFGPLASHESKILPTSLATLLEVAALWQLMWAHRARAHLAAGILLGAWALAQPSALPVLVGGVAIHARRGELRKASIPILVGGLLAIAPASLHNLKAGDFVLISANGGMTFYHGNNETSRFGLLEPSPRSAMGGDAVHQARLDVETASAEVGRPLRASESSRYWFAQGVRSLTADPGRALSLWGQKIVRTVGVHDYADNYSFAVERHEVGTLRLFWVPFPLILIAAATGLVLRGPRGREEWTLALFALVGILTCVVFFVGSRYRCESLPALAILAGRAWTAWAESGRARHWGAGAVGAVLAGLALIPPGVAASTQDSLAGAQWAAALERDRRPRDAAPLYAWAAELDPTNAVAFGRWAALEREARGPEAGLAILDRGIAAGADGPLLRKERGTARISAGDLAGAEADLRLAVQASPRDADAALNLAACLVRRGADEDAGRLLSTPGLERDAVALYYRGLLDVRAARWSQAAARFDSSRAAGATDPRPIVLRALALSRLGNEAKAREILRSWLAEEGDADPEATADRILRRLHGGVVAPADVSRSDGDVWRSVDSALSAIAPAGSP
jgi:4-amino-4-deoxy-L-arabinose transferase-like glycosyltransferase/Flp pilus assembly protein TadD